jgi:hypothetical protein
LSSGNAQTRSTFLLLEITNFKRFVQLKSANLGLSFQEIHPSVLQLENGQPANHAFFLLVLK